MERLVRTRQDLPETIAAAQEIGRVHGYAIAVHGSTMRDLDLLAVPWGANPDTPDELAEALCAGLDCGQAGGWHEKPHGRQGIALAGGKTAHWHGLRTRPGYIDLSVIRPRDADGAVSTGSRDGSLATRGAA